MKRITFFLLILISIAHAQNEVAADITEERQKLLILPSEYTDNPKAPVNKITAILAEQASGMKRYIIMDRSQLVSILDEQALQMTGIIKDSDLVTVGNLSGAREALKVTMTHYSQKGVPPEDKKEKKEKGANFFDAVIAIAEASSEKPDEEPHANNMQTVINFTISKLDLESGQTLNSAFINAEHTGGNRGKSLTAAMNIVRRSIKRELRKMFLLTSEVLEVDGDNVLLFLGADMGIEAGTVYEISSLGRKRTIRGRDITVPGRPVGMVQVVDVSGDASRAVVLRKWGRIEPGFEALERMAFLNGIGFKMDYGQTSGDFDMEFVGFVRPLRRFGGFMNIGLGNIEDSRGNLDLTFGIGGGFHANIIHTSRFRAAGVVSLEGKVVFRHDDEDNSVTAGMFYPMVGLHTSFMMTKKVDLMIAADWVLASTGGKNWQYTENTDDESEETKTYSGKWDPSIGPNPTVTAEGLIFSVGLRFYSF
ncbi:MAG: hypothetical protein QF845_01995 [Candidatus Marinimicrobia bacterium]|nr:hypothetical protein [Candidatus Neomarinimicrobiota bacterium]